MTFINSSVEASVPQNINWASMINSAAAAVVPTAATLGVLLALSAGSALAADEDETFRIGVMLYDSILTSDVTAPLEVFGAAIANEVVENVEIVTIGAEAGLIKTHEGLTLAAEYSVANAPELDAIIVGSSYDMDPVLDNEAFMTFVRERGAEAEWLASNCSGAYVLADAGFLKGVRATTYPGGEVWLKLNHPSINIDINETVVVDQNVITSNGSMVSYAAAFELLKQVAGAEEAREIADTLYYSRLVRAFNEAQS